MNGGLGSCSWPGGGQRATTRSNGTHRTRRAGSAAWRRRCSDSAGSTAFPFSAATKADGLVYVAGTIVAEGDIRNQTRRVLESIDATLQKAGSSLANAASVQVYLKNAGDFAAMNEVYRTFWKADPPVRTTIVADFVAAQRPGRDLGRGGADRRRAPGDPPGRRGRSRPIPTATASRAATRSSWPGMIARNGKDNSVVEGDMAVQTKAVLDNGARDPEGRRHGLRARRQPRASSSPTSRSSRR